MSEVKKNKKAIVLIFDNIIALFLLLTFCFVLIRLLPGNQVDILFNTDVGLEMNQDAYSSMLNRLGLQYSIFDQFISWAKKVLSGDLGYSYIHSASVTSIIASSLFWSLLLVVISLPISIIIGSLSGIYIGLKSERRMSRTIYMLVTILSSIPGYVIALLLLSYFGFYLQWFPSDGGAMSLLARIDGTIDVIDIIHHAILPVLSLVVLGSFRYFYLSYGLSIQIKNRPFVFFAIQRGIKGFHLIRYWIFPSALPEILSRLSSTIPGVITSTIFVEIVFSYPGTGGILIEAINNRDYALVQGTLFVIGCVILLLNTVIDIISAKMSERG